jgi:RND family efflux transporter MFP subunit
MIPSKTEFRSLRLPGLALMTLMLIACGDEPVAEVEEVVRPAKLMTINAGGDGTTREYPGTVSAKQSVELGFEVAGKIVELPISDGLAVKQGALLGRLDDADFVAARESAEANRKATRSAYERAKRIFDQGAGSQAEVDNTLRDIDVARQELVKAQKALDDTVLKAPFSGKISRKIADNFQNVQAKQAIVLLEDVSSLELDISVPEQDFSRMKTGLTLEQRNQRTNPEIQVSTIAGRSFKARLISFETTADPVTRTYRATFAFDNPADVNVLPGMTAKVVLNMPADKVAASSDVGTLIPATAVVVDTDGSAYVWKYDPGSSKVSKAVVTVGNMSGASIRVLSGLQGGEQIATAGAAHMREGMKVRPLGE